LIRLGQWAQRSASIWSWFKSSEPSATLRATSRRAKLVPNDPFSLKTSLKRPTAGTWDNFSPAGLAQPMFLGLGDVAGEGIVLADERRLVPGEDVGPRELRIFIGEIDPDLILPLLGSSLGLTTEGAARPHQGVLADYAPVVKTIRNRASPLIILS
jgi:hypothetical protein